MHFVILFKYRKPELKASEWHLSTWIACEYDENSLDSKQNQFNRGGSTHLIDQMFGVLLFCNQQPHISQFCLLWDNSVIQSDYSQLIYTHKRSSTRLTLAHLWVYSLWNSSMPAKASDIFG